jgi:hypothetical protein
MHKIENPMGLHVAACLKVCGYARFMRQGEVGLALGRCESKKHGMSERPNREHGVYKSSGSSTGTMRRADELTTYALPSCGDAVSRMSGRAPNESQRPPSPASPLTCVVSSFPHIVNMEGESGVGENGPNGPISVSPRCWNRSVGGVALREHTQEGKKVDLRTCVAGSNPRDLTRLKELAAYTTCATKLRFANGFICLLH